MFIPTNALNKSFLSIGGYCWDIILTFLFEYKLPGSVTTILSITFLGCFDLKICAPTPFWIKYIVLMPAIASFLFTVSENAVSDLFKIKYVPPFVNLVVEKPTWVAPMPIGVPVEMYVTSSPFKNLCSPLKVSAAKLTSKSEYTLLCVNPLIFASHEAPEPFPPDIVTDGVVV